MYFKTRLWICSSLATSSIDWGAQTCVAYPSCGLTRLRYSVRRAARLFMLSRSLNVAKHFVTTHTLFRYMF